MTALQKNNLIKAIGYMLLASLCFTVLNSIVKSLAHLPTFELVFFRAVGSTACCMTVLTYKRIPVPGNNRRLLVIRSFVGLIAIVLFFRAIQLMPLGSAVSLRYLSPLFATTLAIPLLQERVKPLQWLFFATALAGVAILKSFDPRISIIALVVILGSAFFTGLVYVIIRKLGASEHPVVIVNYFMVISMIISGVVCIFYWISPVGHEWFLLGVIGFIGFVAQLCMTKALHAAEANIVTPFKYSEVIFTLFAGWLVLGETQTWVALVGITIIIGSLIAMVWVKTKN